MFSKLLVVFERLIEVPEQKRQEVKLSQRQKTFAKRRKMSQAKEENSQTNA